jgi:hypothetical protein
MFGMRKVYARRRRNAPAADARSHRFFADFFAGFFFAGAFFGLFFAAEGFAFFEDGFFDVFLGVAFFDDTFFAAAFFEHAFCADDFVDADFFAAFFVAGFLAGAFFVAAFLADVFLEDIRDFIRQCKRRRKEHTLRARGDLAVQREHGAVTLRRQNRHHSRGGCLRHWSEPANTRFHLLIRQILLEKLGIRFIRRSDVRVVDRVAHIQLAVNAAVGPVRRAGPHGDRIPVLQQDHELVVHDHARRLFSLRADRRQTGRCRRRFIFRPCLIFGIVRRVTVVIDHLYIRTAIERRFQTAQ